MRLYPTFRAALMLGLAVFLASNAFADFPKPRKVKLDLPGLWKDVPAETRYAALEVAVKDAQAQLAERVYGVKVDDNTTVYDLLLVNKDVKSSMEAVLRGATQTEEPEYWEEGMVTVVYGVKLRKVIETLKIDFEKVGGEDLKRIVDYKLDTEDTLVEAMGAGALKDTEGMIMARSIRAAEVDAYSKMVGMVMGIKLTRETKVQALCLKSDKITASIAASIKGLKPMDIQFEDGGGCSVTMQLKIRQYIETLNAIVKRYDPELNVDNDVVLKLNQTTEDQTYTVTGKGSGNKLKDDAETAKADVSSEPMSQTITVFRRVIGESIVVE